jgi:hypothetical protein
VIADGAYDFKDNFRFLDNIIDAEPVMKVRKKERKKERFISRVWAHAKETCSSGAAGRCQALEDSKYTAMGCGGGWPGRHSPP